MRVRKLGIIAGGGSVPARLVAACREEGRPLFLLGIKGAADPAAFPEDADAAWIRLTEAGTGVERLKQAGCEDVVLAGPVRQPSLFELGIPDKFTWRVYNGRAAFGGDDALLRSLTRELEAEGFGVVGVDSLLPEVRPEPGVLGRHAPDDQARADIARAVEVARALGAVDVGQAVVVQQGVVLGVEAVEGTDQLLARCGPLARSGPGGVLVKLCKPGQETRVDLPTVGPVTVENARAAGLRGIALHAGRSLLVEREKTLATADRLGLFIIGIDPDAAP